MKFARRQFLHLAVGAAALPAISRIARAQTYPSRPITIIVPASAGGPLDTLARVTSERMRLSLGQPILIENTGGAAGNIGVGRVARAAADGYTLGVGSWGQYVVNAATYELAMMCAPTSSLLRSCRAIRWSSRQSMRYHQMIFPDSLDG